MNPARLVASLLARNNEYKPGTGSTHAFNNRIIATNVALSNSMPIEQGSSPYMYIMDFAQISLEVSSYGDYGIMEEVERKIQIPFRLSVIAFQSLTPGSKYGLFQGTTV